MIFYFSATGNCQYAAEKLGHRLGVDVVDMTDAIHHKKYTYDCTKEPVGFVLPTYYWGLPIQVAGFLSRLSCRFGKKPYVFLVLTCGQSTGDAGKMFARLMKERNLPFSASYAVKMVDNYVPLFSVPPKEEIARLLEEADVALDEVAASILRQDTGDFNHLKGRAPKLITNTIYPFYRHRRKTRHFAVNEDCIGCGRCQRECPAKTIVMEEGKPVWKKPQCILCLHCLHVCPVHAISYGKRSIKHGHYYNPNV